MMAWNSPRIRIAGKRSQGFTDFAGRVVERYVEHFFPEAMVLARRLR